jgi:hypothetical protein
MALHLSPRPASRYNGASFRPAAIQRAGESHRTPAQFAAFPPRQESQRPGCIPPPAPAELKVDIPPGLPDKPKSGRIPVIRATPGYFSRSERAKSAIAAPMGAF